MANIVSWLNSRAPFPESNISHSLSHHHFSAREERWVHRLTVYGKTSAQFYIENSKSAPLFAAFPIREADLPNREKFGTIFAWVHAVSNRGRTGECSWDAMFRQYLIAKVIKE